MTQEKTLQALHSENERLGLYKEAYAQPEQEPVAYYHPHKGFYFAKPTSVSAPTIVDFEPLALYTTPPQRTWVGLAAEDRLTAKYMQDALDGIEAVIDYIEAKLKEKNT